MEDWGKVRNPQPAIKRKVRRRRNFLVRRLCDLLRGYRLDPKFIAAERLYVAGWLACVCKVADSFASNGYELLVATPDGGHWCWFDLNGDESRLVVVLWPEDEPEFQFVPPTLSEVPTIFDSDVLRYLRIISELEVAAGPDAE